MSGITRFSPAYASTTRRWNLGATTSSFSASRKIAGARTALALATLSKSAGSFCASGPASNHRFHQPNWRRIICRKGGGLCRIRPATCRCAATCSAVVVPDSRQTPLSGDLRGAFEGIERGERSRPQPGEPRGSRAAAEARVIHSPNFDRPVVPHLCFGRDPAIRAIGIAIESQDVDLGLPALLRQFGSGRPNFQFAALEWNWFSNGRAGINAVRRREQTSRSGSGVRAITAKYKTAITRTTRHRINGFRSRGFTSGWKASSSNGGSKEVELRPRSRTSNRAVATPAEYDGRVRK